MRHQTILNEYDPKLGTSISTLAYDYPAGFQVPEHAHGSGQLVYSISGVMEVNSVNKMWLIPPHFALWIPARITHGIRMRVPVSMRTLYIRSRLVSTLPRGCVVLHVTSFFRELILETVRIGQLRWRNYLERALRDLVIAELQKATPVPSSVALPKESRALAVSRSVLSRPSRRDTLAALCADAGVTVRTLQRAFQRDIGIDFDSWRRQVRLIKAIELLVAGCTVKQTAFDVGYLQCSAFVQAFRRTFGTTPKIWISELSKLDERRGA